MAASEAESYRPPQTTRLCILYASQTGTAQDVAERIGREAGRRGFCPAVSSMDEYEIDKLPAEGMAIFVAATTGDGEAPDNMKSFWRFILQRGLPPTALHSLKFSIFGLGDSGYAQFNATARKLQQRLLQLGAAEFCPRGLGDDQSEPLGMDGDLEEWLKQMWPSALKLHPLPAGCTIDDTPELLACRYTVIEAKGKLSTQQTGPTRDAYLSQVPQNAHKCADGSATFQAALTENKRMTQTDWSQDVRHLVFDAPSLPPALGAGDIATVWPHTPAALVQRLCSRLDIKPDTLISVSASSAQAQAATMSSVTHSEVAAALLPPPPGTAAATTPVLQVPDVLTAEELFSKYIDIASVPRRSCFEQLSFFSKGNPEEAEKLREISGPAGADLYASYAKKEKRNIVEILEDFKSVQVPIAFLLELLPPIAPRHFSIASSPMTEPGKVHLCMAVVQYETPFKREISGLCSNWLAKMPVGTVVHMAVRPGLLRLPPMYSAACRLATSSASTIESQAAAAKQLPLPPLILIGPGTGVAPMRGMLREIQAAKDLLAGRSTQPLWDARLYFGCRKASADHLYAEEWDAMKSCGALSSYRCAFSRDGPTKVYVQTLLWEDRESIAAALQHPQCALFIAGNAKRMPTDVLAVLHKVVESAGATPAQAKAHLMAMQQSKRLVIEAWS